ncbi:MAG: TonB-dependent receptor [Saprospiraceae bacterium]|nr:TonB-dependent receptor [Saprospiraceae bacterium]
MPEAVEDLDRASGQFKSIIEQEKLPSAFSLDFFIYKSFNFWKRFSSISFAANNLLNNKNMISGGFEQSRFDYETKDPTVFPNKYFYLQGINYNLSLNISLWKQ